MPRGRAFTITAAAVIGAALALDEPLHRMAAAHQTRRLDRLAGDVDPFGRAQYLVPALAASVALPFALGDRTLAWSALRVSAGYAAADLVGGVLRVAVARHRPDSTGNAWRFRPLRPQGDWGSMPSAHATHAFAIAGGIAEESGRPWAAGLAYGIASLVAMQRVYTRAHWTSDVAVAAAMSTAASRAVIDFQF